jgi:hypothetical protein
MITVQGPDQSWSTPVTYTSTKLTRVRGTKKTLKHKQNIDQGNLYSNNNNNNNNNNNSIKINNINLIFISSAAKRPMLI